ncbi:CHAT domain-containing protein [Streptomyces aureus]
MSSPHVSDQSFIEHQQVTGREYARQAQDAGLGSEELAAVQAAHLKALEQERNAAIAAVREEARQALQRVHEKAEDLEKRLGELRKSQATLNSDMEECRRRVETTQRSLSPVEVDTAGSQDFHLRRNQGALTAMGVVEFLLFQYSLVREGGLPIIEGNLSPAIWLSAALVTAISILFPFIAGMWLHTGRRHRLYRFGSYAVAVPSALATAFTARSLTVLPGTYFLSNVGEWLLYAVMLFVAASYSFYTGHTRQLAAVTTRFLTAREELASLDKSLVELGQQKKETKRVRGEIPRLRELEQARFTEAEALVAARYEAAAHAFTAGVIRESLALSAGHGGLGLRPELPSPSTSVTPRPLGATSGPVPAQRVDRLLVADYPLQVSPGDRISLVLRIVVLGSSRQFVKGAPLKEFEVPAQGVEVMLTVQAREGLSALGSLNQTLTVPANGDSEPALFDFEVLRPGMLHLHAIAWVGGTFVGEIDLEISAEPGARSGPVTTKGARMGPLLATPGEATLQLKRAGDRYEFQVLTEHIFYSTVAMSLPRNLDDPIERTIRRLEEFCRGTGSDWTRRRNLQSLGVKLWNEMVPGPIADQFWEIRDSITRFSIATEDDVIPWELLYPMTRTEDHGFLVEQFPVSRRVYNQARVASISIAQSAFVVPPKASPSDAGPEVLRVNSYLRRHLGIGHGTILRDTDDILQWIDKGAPGLLHFACHNTFDVDQGGSCIPLQDNSFTPDLLELAVTRKDLEQHSPLVFFNACRSAGAAYAYTRLNSWATEFMRAGAGGFVGTLWAVPSKKATEFSEAFYEAFVSARQPLGTAVMTARNELHSPTDPTWLAYTVYGDPSTGIS